MSTVHSSYPTAFFLEANTRRQPWWKNPASLASIGVHASAIVLLWAVTQHLPPTPVTEHAIELVMEKIAPPKVTEPPKPETVAKPVALAQPKSQPVTRAQPKTVDVPAEKAETYTSPKQEVAPQPVAPVEAAPPAPAVAKADHAAPKVIATEGIPTDYVNQVYSRINRNASYPRAARIRREEGKVGYRLTLSPQGELLKFDIQSSGNEDLDEAAIKAIKAAAPFPKLPDLGGSAYLLAGAILFKIN